MLCMIFYKNYFIKLFSRTKYGLEFLSSYQISYQIIKKIFALCKHFLGDWKTLIFLKSLDNHDNQWNEIDLVHDFTW